MQIRARKKFYSTFFKHLSAVPRARWSECVWFYDLHNLFDGRFARERLDDRIIEEENILRFHMKAD